jgi:hypothetical protein
MTDTVLPYLQQQQKIFPTRRASVLHKQGTRLFQAPTFQTSPPSTARLAEESTFAAAADEL